MPLQNTCYSQTFFKNNVQKYCSCSGKFKIRKQINNINKFGTVYINNILCY